MQEDGFCLKEEGVATPSRACAHCRDALAALLESPSFLVFCVSAAITAALHSLIFAFFGMWVEAFFNLSASAATATTIAIGSAELLGQLAAIFCVSDKVHALSTLLVDHVLIGLGIGQCASTTIVTVTVHFVRILLTHSDSLPLHEHR